MESWQTLDLLAALVEKSLVVYEETAEGQGRYRMQETLRQYSRDRLLESGEGEVMRDQHQAFFAHWVESGPQTPRGNEARLWWECLETEHDNLRAAMHWQTGQAGNVQAQVALRLANRLTSFWGERGFVSEGRGHLTDLLQATQNDVKATELRIAALKGAGDLAIAQGDLPQATSYLTECLRLCGEHGYREKSGETLMALGIVAVHKGNNDEARACFEQSLAVFEELGDTKFLVVAALNLGTLAVMQGELDVSEKALTQALRTSESYGYTEHTVRALHNLGLVAYYRRDWSQSRRLYERSLSLSREAGSRHGIARTQGSLANTLLRQNETVLARAALQESLFLSQSFGDRPYIALLLESFADLAEIKQQPLRAVQILGAAHKLREQIGVPLSKDEQAEYDRTFAALQATANPSEWNTAWNAGLAFTLDQAIGYALDGADQ